MEKVGGNEGRLVTGSEVELHIDSIAYGGSGVGRIEGKAVFVPLSVPGDNIRARVVEDKGRYAVAEIVEILSPSADRIDPECPHFGVCGGCDIQQLEYQEQLKQKRHIVADALGKALGTEMDVSPVLPSPKTYGYRNRAQLRYVKQGEGAALGYYARSSHTLVPVDNCPIIDPRLNELLEGLSTKFPKGIQDLEGEMEFFINRHGIARFSRPGESGFSQVNDGANVVLVEYVRGVAEREKAKLDRPLAILDLYCGNGNLSLPLMPYAKKILGTDLASRSVKAANAAAVEAAGTSDVNVRYLREPTNVTVGKLSSSKTSFDLAILDPPRAGLADLATRIASLNIPLIIYVSCVPPILGRDVKVFVDSGYNLVDVQPVDMFPQTHHVETIAVLEKR